jgi:hypothetical protein
MNDRMTKTARDLKRLLIECSPRIEEHTRSVCPACTDVCCRQKHGMFTAADQAYLAALGEEVPAHDPARPPDAVCQFLEPDGCAKPRWQRAWKCTWYFCEPLLQALAQGPQREARDLSRLQNEIMRLYDRLNGGQDG